MGSLNNIYFKWLLQLVCDNQHKKTNYSKLLTYLHNVEFGYILEMDENRAEDGIELRYRFGYEYNYSAQTISEEIVYPCSVLEMMAALALRCEEHIMADEDYGNRTSLWFWTMIFNLDLENMTNDHFSKEFVDVALHIMLHRTYKRNGEGGLFVTNNPKIDMRETEIWYQLMAYLNDISGG